MRIRRVVLRNVRNFGDFDRLFADPWTEGIPDSLLLLGPNGSGKTTLLEVMADLWQLLESYLVEKEKGSHVHEIAGEYVVGALKVLERNNVLPDTPDLGLVAVEVVGLEEKPVWIYTGEAETCRGLVEEQENVYRVGTCHHKEGNRLLGFYYDQDPARDPAWRRQWAERLEENVLGKREDLPNVVYLASEHRVLLPVEEEFSVQREQTEFRWLARYEPTASRKGSLQNYLYNLKVVDEDAFAEVVARVNDFLVGKHLGGFDRRTGELLVEVDGRGVHPIEALSSGEKQVLLMLVTITRWLRPRGVVLIDEPDLHLHPSLTTAFVGYLRRMVAQMDGQLIIASHAQELWQDFTPSHRVELGGLEDEARQ